MDKEKIEKILAKTFCFTKTQEKEANGRGEEVMNSLDIKYIKSLKVKIRGKYFLKKQKNINESFLKQIKVLKKSGIDHIFLNKNQKIFIYDADKIESAGYFLSHDNDVNGWVIHTSKKAKIEWELLDFQHFIKSIIEVRSAISVII